MIWKMWWSKQSETSRHYGFNQTLLRHGFTHLVKVLLWRSHIHLDRDLQSQLKWKSIKCKYELSKIYSICNYVKSHTIPGHGTNSARFISPRPGHTLTAAALSLRHPHSPRVQTSSTFKSVETLPLSNVWNTRKTWAIAFGCCILHEIQFLRPTSDSCHEVLSTIH